MLKNTISHINKEQMKTKIIFSKKNLRINLEVKRCNYLQRITGLMFKRREKAEALLFKFDYPSKMSIHSFFVFFSFIAVWIDEKGRIISVDKVSPFTFSVSSKREYMRLIEIPINKRYSGVVKFLVGD